MALKKNIVDYIKLGLIVGAVILLDQLTKHLVRSNMAPGEIFPQGHWLVHYVRIIHWHNSGTVGGVFQGMGVVFTALAFIVSGAILYYYPRIPAHERAMRLGLGIIMGGALGNVIDRLLRGYVTDFISIGGLPVMNIADLSLGLGGLILFFVLWNQDKKQNQPGDTPVAASQASKPIEPEAPVAPGEDAQH